MMIAMSIGEAGRCAVRRRSRWERRRLPV